MTVHRARCSGRIGRVRSPNPTHIRDAAGAAALFPDFRTASIEHAGVVLLDPEWRYLGTTLFTGGQDSVTPSLRAIVGAALAQNAAGLILVHNHPSGHAEPSQADVVFTAALSRVCDPLDLDLIDHLILTAEETTSFRACGLL
ncbi:JAB domain-containing protein [Sphingomonas sp. MA1305]|uniref:JAB domain-containing protein n=1 Tax=Sphingomonas sp. MA1305 TaxID=2479204 RepID=UPI0018DF6E80|nr:JAB domain-containing protein [Sphingomonas sp. MA1305]